jgi:O-acetyl-ADP-ribose deacetylase (regulator of RNase III)
VIHLTEGDILKHDADALVNTVNCVGVMGRGIALQFRRAFKDNYEAYRRACNRKEIRLGQMFVFERSSLDSPRWIINFPTKLHWKGRSQLKDIRSGLVDLVRVVREKQIRSIAIPPLGCGLGGLDWNVVRPIIEESLSSVHDVDVYLFEPGGVPGAKAMVNRTERPTLTEAKGALIGLMERYLGGLMDATVTLLEIYKLAYLLEVSGEPLRLQFTKGHYGPYSERLSHMINDMEGHYIIGYGEGGDTPGKPIELIEGAAEQAREVLRAHPETLARFAKVSRLIEGFESPYGMELLSTVHWVADRDRAASLDEAVQKVHAWSERKKMFTSYQIGAAWERLCELDSLRSRVQHFE